MLGRQKLEQQGGRKLKSMTKLVRALLAVVAVFSVPQMSPATPVKEVRRVVIFYELGLSSPAVAVIDQQIRTALENSQFQIELYREYLETTLFPDPATQQEFREWYIHKYQHRKIDLVIALGRSPVKFMADAHEKAFTDVPIVFGGTSEDLAGHPNLDHHFTGVWERFEPAKTLELALKLLPGTKNVVVVGGTSAFDRRLEDIFRQSLHGYETKLDFTYLTDLDMPTLLERLKYLPEHTVILYTHLGEDAAGLRFVGASQADPMITSAANAPIFSPSDVDLGHLEVGGYLQSFAAEGKIVAEMALSILNGKSPQDIPVVTGANAYMFDWRALQRWGLKESDLPPGSIVLNRQPTVWEAYKAYIIGGISLILVETLLILGLVWQKARRTQAERKLRESQNRLAGIVGSAMDAIIAIDEEQRIVLFNAAAEKMFGCTQDEAVGTVIHRFIPQRFRSGHGAYIRRFGESGVTTRKMGTPAALWAVRNNGQEFPMEASITCLESDGRKLFTVTIRDITERKLAEDAMADIGRKLIQAHEEERTWIARELHDDVNQRMALLAIELDRWNQQLPPSAVEFHDHIHHASQRLSDIAKDIQALSHRLHSSKLEYLGIVAAAKSFCKELSEQQKVEIDFSDTAIPRSVPKEISLCLFRVLQETLQNAVKHSGMRHFKVELRGTEREIQLTVSDLGVGFDPQDAIHRRGLGLISMRERMQLVGGEISIQSQPGGGTTIHARVPFRGTDSMLAAG